LFRGRRRKKDEEREKKIINGNANEEGIRREKGKK
jgi:hypothetical protein